MTRGFQGVFHDSIALVNIPGSGVLILERNAGGGIDLTLGAFSGHADNSPYTASAPAPMRGSYTVLLPPDPGHAGDTTVPQGTGFATLKINPLGIARCVGRVGDGAPFAFDSSVHGDGTLPCYDGLYTAPHGSIGGTLTFRDLDGSDFDGTLDWSRQAQTNGSGLFRTALAAGFAEFSVPAIGSFYQPAATPLQMLVYADNHRAMVTFHDGGLTAPMSGTATVSAALSAFVTPPMRTLYFSPSDGTFLGTLRPASASAAPKPFFGIVFQKQNRGAGLFLGTGAVGGLDYTPQPGSTARR